MTDLTTNLLIVVLVFVMIVVTWVELRYMRRRSKARKDDATARPQLLQDEAHNALLTTRAIATTLAERGGIRGEDVDSILREAQMAYDRRNYRVTIDLTRRAKDRLVTLRSQQTGPGDLAQLNDPAATSAPEETTTKELLQKEYPPNLVQSKFAISLAESSIEASEASGRDSAQARTLLVSAQARFDAEDYSGALSVARQAERSAKGETVVTTISPPPTSAAAVPPSVLASSPPLSAAAVPLGSVCPSCGVPMKPDDTFCRKCGTRVGQTDCPNCDAALQMDDAFCRKCGTRLQR